MLRDQTPMCFVATSNADASRNFYANALGLTFVEDTPFALVFTLGQGEELRIQKLDAFTPPPNTVLGWAVDDIAAKVRELEARGISFARYDHMEQDELGIWTSPSGARVAWFHDPCGNNLSLTQNP